jgi:hypothetical protein
VNLSDPWATNPTSTVRVDRVSVADGATRTVRLGITGNFTPIAIHPDGRRIFFIAGHGANELWELSGWSPNVSAGVR